MRKNIKRIIFKVSMAIGLISLTVVPSANVEKSKRNLVFDVSGILLVEANDYNNVSSENISKSTTNIKLLTSSKQRKNSKKNSKKDSTNKKKRSKEKKIIADAEEAVKKLETNQISENLQPAQTAVDKITNENKKSAFQNRIEAVKNAILEKAEEAVKNLEDNQIDENLQAAQNAVNQVTNDEQKSSFQNRIESVKSAIAQRQEEERQAQAAALAEQQANRTVYVTQYGKNDVYWYDTSNMPSNTRFDKVVPMTEADAIAQGKHHSMKE